MLNARHQGVLRAIVLDYIRTAEPVGSRTISRKYGFSLSPATIRTIMADLEELGYLAQPHTSAGRIPTDQGYRFYVDALMDRPSLSQAEVERIEHHVGPEAGEVDELLSQADLDRIGRYLTGLLHGKSLRKVRDLLLAQMAEEKAQYDRLLSQALQLGAKALEGEAEADVYVAGAAHIADLPEFADIGKMKALYAAFEEKSKLVKILNECLSGEGCRIFIGREIPVEEIQELSVIAAPYGRGDRALGVLGMLGPTRMDYGRALALVETTATLLTRVLTEGAAQPPDGGRATGSLL